MASAESIALSGLLTSQRLLDLTGQNIANAQTPGYHRQVATLGVRGTGQEGGLGVEVEDVRRQIDQNLERAVTNNSAAVSDVAAQLDTLRPVETQLNPTDGSVHELLEQLFNQFEQLAGRPDDITQRRGVLNTASALSEKLNSLYAAIQQQYDGVQQQVVSSVAQVNQLAKRIAELNVSIERNTVQGADANALSDQRDQLINQLANLVDVRVVGQPYGAVNVLAAGVPLVLGGRSLTLRAGIDAKNQSFVAAEGLDASLSVTGGQLHGLLALRNDALNGVFRDLQTLTHTLIQKLDATQATGLALSGPFSILYGQRGVTNTHLPLAQAGLGAGLQAGSLFVSVTNLATGERTLHELVVNPQTQSLQDVATALDGIDHLQAVIDQQTQTLTVLAQPGYAFDFAGQLPSAPQTVSMSGTSTPQVSGRYTGDANDDFTYTVVGSGAVGVTTGLTLEARNSAGTLSGRWNIGAGYEPGSELPAIDGVTARLSSGTVNNGDSFSARVVAAPDSAGLLPALGLNAFFQGDLGTLSVRDDLLQNPDRLSGSRTGLPADGSNLQQFAALRDQPFFDNGTSTFGQFYGNIAADVGSRVQELEGQHTALDALGRGLEAERQSVSGVDPNQELVQLVQYQRAFQLSAQFLTVVNDTLADLMRLA